ncbi:MAG: mechanosensitive ion channel [Calditrichaeota bacterium]|nr:mechanosensitive ion channel [Calditrichota bacterium]HQU73699.1 mechanosensitive ion channel [Calditrichia bacterium]
MTDYLGQEFSRLTFLEALLMAGVLFLLLRGLKILLGRRLADGPFHQSLNRFWSLGEALVWLLFSLFLLDFLFSGSLYRFLGMVAVLGSALGLSLWFVGRDWFAGLVLKTVDNLQVGQRLKLGEVEGDIVRLGDTRARVRTTSGETAEIPYSRISAAVLWKGGEGLQRPMQLLTVTVSGAGSEKEAVMLLKRAILEAPWSDPGSEPQIELQSEQEEERTFAVRILLSGKVFERQLRTYLDQYPALRVDG